MLNIIYGKLLNSDPDPEKIFRIRQKDADPTGSGSATLVKMHIQIYNLRYCYYCNKHIEQAYHQNYPMKCCILFVSKYLIVGK
jgi:hypothetical protein